MQFPFLPVGVKWKVVKNVHCPPLLIDTGLMSIGPIWIIIFSKLLYLELLPFIAECVTNIENKTNLTPLSVFRACVRRAAALSVF